MFRQLGRRIRYLLNRDRFAEELREEMELHVELRSRAIEDRGAALRRFGNRGAAYDRSIDAWGWLSAERLLQDLRQAYRVLRGSPGFTAMAVLTLALGLGINTAIFTVVNAVIFRGLPYPDPDQLLSVYDFNLRPNPRLGPNARRNNLAPANLEDYSHAAAFAPLAAYDVTPMNLTRLGPPERLQGESITFNYFDALGVSPLLGRAFLPEEDREGGERVVILSYQFWQQRLAGDPQVLSRNVTLDGIPRRVVGVMPAGFRSPGHYLVTGGIQYYVPAAAPRALLASRGDHEVFGIARLRSGATLQQARDQLAAIGTALGKQFPDTNGHIQPVVVPLRDDLVRNTRDSMFTLLGSAGLILLITCVNVAGLLTVRAAARRHETSVRFALGAGRVRIVRQFIAESALLTAAGLGLGLIVGRVFTRMLVALAPPNTPRIDAVSTDWRVFAAAALAAGATAAIFGLAPAWHASQANAGDALKSAARSIGSQARWRSVLTVVEVALSVILLVGAGLMLKSFTVLMGVDLGFQADHVMVVNTTLPAARYPTGDHRLRFFQQLEERVRALPGIQSAAFANRMPMRGGWGTGITLDDGQLVDADSQAVSPGYFATLGIPLLRGRLLSSQDYKGTASVALVNHALARKYWHGTDPTGHRFRRNENAPWVEVVGVVNDIRRGGKTGELTPQIYLPAAQTELYPVALADFAVRTAGDPRQLLNAIQAEVWRIDSEQPVTNIRTLEEIIDAQVAQRRFQTLLLTIFAAVAVGLAVIGIYGVLAYAVNQRRRELGIRVALGARPANILAMVLRQAGLLIGAGLAAGLTAAYGLARFIESLLFQVPVHDWTIYAAAMGVLAVVAVAASLIPARRGALVDPAIALRCD